MSLKNTPLTEISGIGEKRAALYRKLGINNVWDLLTFYPRDYVDFNSPIPIGQLENGENAVFHGFVSKKLRPYISTRYSIFKCIVSDESGDILCTFFNSKFSFDKLIEGEEYIFYGKITGDFLRKETSSPLFISAKDENRLTPKYHLTGGLTRNMVAANLHSALKMYNEPDLLGEKICSEYNLADKKTALNMIHFPRDIEQYNTAKRRLAFEEMLVLQLGLSLLKNRNRSLTGAPMKQCCIEEFYRSLPFAPTNAQLRSVNECIADMCGETPMNRLLQGDVGSGKTLVAAAVCFFAHKNGFQSTLMAPTEILAQQHYETLSAFLKPLGVNIILLTGSLTPKEKKEAKAAISDGTAHIIVGTQALIQKGVEFHRLGLVVTDEQHRFGVGQRSTLAEKGENPHVLVMSATPIPRTLALIIYGDLDISVLDEMPKGRIPVKTYGVDTSYRPRLYKFIRKYVEKGFQAYIVCPAIEESENEKASAVAYYNELCRDWFSDISVGLLHGKMKQAEKDEVMQKFKNNEIKVLVSTTVIEVGVDVPNAVVMVIENAEQFGLSQLHQLRGRVGRGTEQSHCILVSDSKTDYTRARIDTMVRTTNGFEIAGEDLRLRGPGDFFGSMQHGLPQLKIADMNNDIEMLNETRALAAKILEKDETLSAPENKGLKQLVTNLFADSEEYGFN